MTDKPRIWITRVLDILFPREKNESLVTHGSSAHEIVYEKYRKRICNDIEVEKKVELDMGDYILVGKIDIVDNCNKWIAEVKTIRQLKLDARARMQLSAYVEMYRRAFNNFYYGVFVIYDWKNPENFRIVKPFYLDMTVLKTIDEVVKENWQKLMKQE